MLTKKELKHIVLSALESEYGFKPNASEIKLQEDDCEGTYIRFAVQNHEYEFNSHNCGISGVWVGSGTITKIN